MWRFFLGGVRLPISKILFFFFLTSQKENPGKKKKKTCQTGHLNLTDFFFALDLVRLNAFHFNLVTIYPGVKSQLEITFQGDNRRLLY